MLIFIISIFAFQRSATQIVFVGVPFAFFILSIREEKFINRFSIELLWLSSGLVAVGNNYLIYLGPLYLLSLYFYASPCPRFSFPFRPFTIKRSVLADTFKEIEKIKGFNIRIGFLYLVHTPDEWRLMAKYSTIFSNWIISQSTPFEWVSITTCSFGGEISINAQRPISDELQRISRHYSISYFLAASKYIDRFDIDNSLSVAATCSLPPIGSVPGCDFLLLKTGIDTEKISPDGKICESDHGGFSVTCTAGEHEIKYQYFPGLTATQGGRELPIYPGSDLNFHIRAASGSDIWIRYDKRQLWLPPCPTDIFNPKRGDDRI
jgi:hypothetical protein